MTSTDEAAVRARILAAVREEWQKARPAIAERLESLARLVELSARDPQARTDARDEAHRMCGTLGTFGLRHTSEAARTLESLLMESSPGDHLLEAMHRLMGHFASESP